MSEPKVADQMWLVSTVPNAENSVLYKIEKINKSNTKIQLHLTRTDYDEKKFKHMNNMVVDFYATDIKSVGPQLWRAACALRQPGFSPRRINVADGAVVPVRTT